MKVVESSSTGDSLTSNLGLPTRFGFASVTFSWVLGGPLWGCWDDPVSVGCHFIVSYKVIVIIIAT